MGIGSQAELICDQEVYLVVRGEGKGGKPLIEDDHLVILECVWHTRAWVHDLSPWRSPRER